jgi:hypothetical protein
MSCRQRMMKFVTYTLGGIVLTPALVLCYFASYEPTGFSWESIKAAFVANLQLAAVLAVIGGIIGLLIGLVVAIRGKA